jgi:hypothetical protein
MEDFNFYFDLGWHHIISIDALDHILFITALAAIFTLEQWKPVLILVTAFTVGHSVTLALSVFDVLRISGEWIEFLIPCTIICTCLANIFQQRFANNGLKLNYYLALFFGLIHGMGFANTIRFMLVKDQKMGIGLLAFNLGLEFGQIFIIIMILVIAFVFLHLIKVNRREWVIFLSSTVFGLSFKMALERFPV